MFKLNKENKSVRKLTKVSYEDLGYKERADIQEWIAENPSILTSHNKTDHLLIISKEYMLPSGIRLDLLAIDQEANLVIIELKRDSSGKNVFLQAIKYAAYCSAFKNDEIYQIYAEYLSQSIEEAKQKILNFIGDSEDDLNNKQRLILVAKDFDSDVIASVLWLRAYNIDISCIKLEPLLDEDSQDIFLDSNMIIPLPEAEDYIKRKENKEQEKTAIRSTFCLEKTNLEYEELKIRLKKDLRRDGDQTPRFKAFLEILLNTNQPLPREEVREILFSQYQIGEDIGQAGRFLSNLSQYLTKPKTGHLRQMINFDVEGGPCSPKTNFLLKKEFKNLVQEALREMEEF